MNDPWNDGDRTPVMRSVEESIPVEGPESVEKFSSAREVAPEESIDVTTVPSTSRTAAYGTADARSPSELPIELYEERLVTQTRRIKTGEVKISKRIVTNSASEDIPLTKEKIIIEIESIYSGETRIDIGEAETAEDGSIRMGIYEEQALSCRRVVPYQNVSVRKEIVSDTVTAQEMLRREQLDIKVEGNPVVEER